MENWYRIAHRETGEEMTVASLSGINLDVWEIVTPLNRGPINEACRRRGNRLYRCSKTAKRSARNAAAERLTKLEMLERIEALEAQVAALSTAPQPEAVTLL